MDQKSVSTSLFRAASVIAIFSLLSRLVGLYRDRLLAGRFGAGDVLDAYYAAFRVPDFIFNLLILGTLSVAFIPVFTEYYIKNKKEANEIASTIVTFTFVFMSCVCVVLLFFISPITHLIAPGFTGEKFLMTVSLSRVMLLSPLIFALSSIFGSILYSLKRFFIPSVAPVLYNFGIIFGALYLYPICGVIGLAYGVIAGAFLHMLAQFIDASIAGFSLKPNFRVEHPAVKKIAKLFLPRILGVDNAQISLLIASIIGSVLGSGALTVFNFANNLQAVPIGIFGIAFATAIFPTLSEHFASGSEEKFVESLKTTFLHVAFLAIPASVLMWVLKGEIVSVLLSTGKYVKDAALTASVLGAFSFSIWAQSINPLLSRAFYSRHNTVTPVSTGLFSLFVGACLSYYFALRFGTVGLAVGFSCAEILNFVLLATLLSRAIPNRKISDLALPIFKILICSAIAGLAALVLGNILFYAGSSALPFITNIILFAIVSVAGVSVYFGLGSVLGIAQTKYVLGVVKRRILG